MEEDAQDRKIIGERCVCGHLIKDHTDRRTIVGDTPVPIPKHGFCQILGCYCTRFTWKEFITK